MNIKRYIYSIAAVLAALSAGSCAREYVPGESGDTHTVPLAVSAAIGGTTTAATRAAGAHFNKKPWEDRWSYYRFTEGDRMGFFSRYGDPETPNGKGPLTNIPMTYGSVEVGDKDGNKKSYGVFTSDEVANINPSLLSDNTTFAYFPYDENTSTETGFELRRTDDTDTENPGVLKCVDFLLVEQGMDVGRLDSEGMLYAELYHGFSELIIMRGKGFDAPPKGFEAINVVLKPQEGLAGYTHLKINPKVSGNSWSCEISLVYAPDKVTNSRDDSDYLRWEAWVGDNYAITDEDKEGRPASYVILPTLEKGSIDKRVEVDYIELYDNEGIKQTVSALKLSNDAASDKDPARYTKRLTPGWRYPFEISMQELGPTVNPFPIVGWEENRDITDERKCGIYSQQEFSDWLEAYNAYLSDKGETNFGKLLQYGDRVYDNDNKFLYWKFYLRTDLDECKADENGVIIPELRDVLDGLSYTLSNSEFQNHSIKRLKNIFVGEMDGEYAAIQNITFSRPEINTPNNTAAVGVVVGTMSGGTVKNCNVNSGNIISGGPVGMIAGTMSGGSIEDCDSSGMLIGASTYNNIVGEHTGGTFKNNRTNVVFSTPSK